MISIKFKLYKNGHIITMNEDNMHPECVVTRKDKISFVGDIESAMKIYQKPEIIDLDGNTLLPGFIDSHSHFFYTALTQSNMVNLSQPPIGDVSSIEDLISTMKKSMKDNVNTSLIGFGYDESLLADKREPTKDDLDKIATDRPVAIIHQASHKGVMNSFLLNELNINEDTPDPEGGRFGRYPNTSKPNGICEENAFFNQLEQFVPTPAKLELFNIIKEGQAYYAKEGITTVQDGRVTHQLLKMYKSMQFLKRFYLDIVGYYFINSVDDIKVAKKNNKQNKKYKGFRLGGAKILLDGSPQAKTAWLTKPYHKIPNGRPDDYKGYPLIEDEDTLQSLYTQLVNRKLQVLTHANGDAASDQLLKCYMNALKASPHSDELRPVMVHAQTVREDQLDLMKEINMIPSFFQMHTYFWGDWHLNSVLGDIRGNRISPTKSAQKRNMVYTLHADSPVLPPDTMFMLHAAVNRNTHSGKIIGPDQRISVLEVLKAQTIYAAYQYFEEDKKGSLEQRKIADMVILDKNPLDVEKDKLKEIIVLETIKRGKTVYKK